MNCLFLILTLIVLMGEAWALVIDEPWIGIVFAFLWITDAVFSWLSGFERAVENE